MDSGNMTETKIEDAQPVDVVVTDTETTEAKPQAEATEKNEVYVEVEGDQQEEPNKMSEKQLRAAWKEEKRKRKDKSAQGKELLEKVEKLEKQLLETNSVVRDVRRGQRPQAKDFIGAEEYAEAITEWEESNKPVESKPSDKQTPSVVMSDDQEWHLHQSERELRNSLADYDDVKVRVESELIRAFDIKDGYHIMNQIAQYAHTFDVDPAKAFYAMDKIPGAIDDLVKNANNQAQIGRILRDLESKVKVRERKPINSQPEPNIKGGGEVNAINQEISKAKERYYADATLVNHRKLQAARAKKKVNKDG